MSFVDKVEVHILAGKGGDGHRSFRHERYISKGGPDGGDGGDGGNVVFEASRNQNTLSAFRYDKEIEAEAGHPGGKSRKHGRNGKSNIVRVPVGTQVHDNNGILYADLINDGQQEIIANGGKGGFGNAHFVSSVRQTPNFAEKGEPGDGLTLTLELKLIADVGLVGLPNAGKSTLLSKLSNARPEIADYPFTTLRPNLGVVDVDDTTSLLLADIPGLIEGAAEGKGLGHEFLRHVERTRLIVHLIDVYNDDVASVYSVIRNELKAYSPKLAKLKEIVVLTKVEGLSEKEINTKLAELKKVVAKSNTLVISAASGLNLDKLKYELKKQVTTVKKIKKVVEEDSIPVLTIQAKPEDWKIEKVGKDYVVKGKKIETFAKRTDMNNDEGVDRLKVIMRRYGIIHELYRMGIKPGDYVFFGDTRNYGFEY